MCKQIAIGEGYRNSFPVFDFDGYTKVSGQSDFKVSLYYNNEVSDVPVSVSEIDTTGEYGIEFEPDSVGFWKIEVYIPYNSDVYTFELDVTVSLTNDMFALLKRAVGLVHENVFIDNTTYDPDGQLLSARIRIFDSASNCELATNGGTEIEGVIGVYNLETVWEALNKYQTFKQVRIG